MSMRSTRCAISPSWGGWGGKGSSDSRAEIWAGVVWVMIQASQVRNVGGDMWRAAPPFDACRIMACTSCTAALCFLLCGLNVLAGQAPAMWVHESGAPHKRQASVGWSPYLCAILPLYSCPHRNFRSRVAWAGHGVRLLVICDALVAKRAPSLEARRIRRGINGSVV